MNITLGRFFRWDVMEFVDLYLIPCRVSGEKSTTKEAFSGLIGSGKAFLVL